jgi:hypothetical protein
VQRHDEDVHRGVQQVDRDLDAVEAVDLDVRGAEADAAARDDADADRGEHAQLHARRAFVS